MYRGDCIHTSDEMQAKTAKYTSEHRNASINGHIKLNIMAANISSSIVRS